MRDCEAVGLKFEGGEYKVPPIWKRALPIARSYVGWCLGAGALFLVGALLHSLLTSQQALPVFWAVTGAVATLALLHSIGRPAITAPDLEFQAGRIALSLGATALAIALLARAAETKPGTEIHLALGEAYFQTGRVGEAKQQWNMALASAAGVTTDAPLRPVT